MLHNVHIHTQSSSFTLLLLLLQGDLAGWVDGWVVLGADTRYVQQPSFSAGLDLGLHDTRGYFSTKVSHGVA